MVQLSLRVDANLPNPVHSLCGTMRVCYVLDYTTMYEIL